MVEKSKVKARAKRKATRFALTVEADVKKAIAQAAKIQKKVKKAVGNGTWKAELQSYATKQGKELSKLIKGDVAKVQNYLKTELKQLEKVQGFINEQTAELSKVLTRVKTLASTRLSNTLRSVRSTTSKKS